MVGRTRPTRIRTPPTASPSCTTASSRISASCAKELAAEGAKFTTETDTEVIAHLVTEEMKAGRSPSEAVAAALPRLRGAFALAFLFEGENDLLIGARKGSPLAVGYGDGEMYLGSDAIALAPFTDTISYLEDGDWAVVRRDGVKIFDAAGRPAKRAVIKSLASAFLVDKGNHRHFMAKEIHEQPEVVGHTLAHYLDMATERVALPVKLPFDFRDIQRISISACGTAYYAGLVAKYWFERFARLPVEIDIASEFRYREAPLRAGDLAIFVSQSGETADTLASLRYAREQRQHILSVVNVPTSTIARESDVVMPTLAGPEIGVASTKAFTCQLAALACLAIAAGRARGALSEVDERKLVHALIEVPRLMNEALALEPEIEQLARDLSKSRDVLYLGRGTSFPLALEGALKLKEISYIHAEGYAAGELKHGPIALIDETMPVIVIAPYDRVFEKTVSNMQEVAARRPHHPGHRSQGRPRRRDGLAGDVDAAGNAGLGHPAGLRHPGAADRLPHGGHHGHRRGPAAQSGEVGDGGINAARCRNGPLNPPIARTPVDSAIMDREQGSGIAACRAPSFQLRPMRAARPTATITPVSAAARLSSSSTMSRCPGTVCSSMPISPSTTP